MRPNFRTLGTMSEIRTKKVTRARPQAQERKTAEKPEKGEKSRTCAIYRNARKCTYIKQEKKLYSAHSGGRP